MVCMGKKRLQGQDVRTGCCGGPVACSGSGCLQGDVAQRIGYAGQHAALGLFFGTQSGPVDAVLHLP